jgi:serine/threonine-protein kinase
MPAEQVRGLPRPNSDIYALGIIAIQALTGLHPKQLLEDLDTGEIIWQHQADVSTELACILNKMVGYHFKQRYQSAAEVLEALQPLATLYQPIQYSGLYRQKTTSAQLGETTKQKLPALLSEQETIPFVWGDRSEEVLDDTTSDATHPTPSNRSVLLIGMAIGVASVLALTLCLYYLLRLPAPASKVQQYQVLIPTKNKL